MCDTIVHVLPGKVLFAKNSDRDPNEAQVLDWQPRRVWSQGAELDCTWIRIPQARESHAVLLSRPYWMWGAEMGANEHGVVIGNEAVFTNQPYAKTGLTGMDLLRLALERADSARAACEVIIALLETHGQGGGCGHEHRGFTYHNSFLVADPRGAYVLETAGKHWAIEPVQGARSISNGLTIPDFRERYASKLHERVSACRVRRARTESLAQGALGATDMMALLRDYGAGRDAPAYSIINGGMGAACMHAGGLLASAQTTGSWVAELSADGVQHWATGTAIPSLSLFKPVQVDVPVDLGTPPTDRADRHSLWWKHERLCRKVLRQPQPSMGKIRVQCEAIEKEWLATPPQSAEAFARHDALLEVWLAEVSIPETDERPWYVQRYWRKRDAMAGLV